MDINQIENWLRTSIPGIIILGAFGSIFGFFLLRIIPKIAKWIFRKLQSILATITLPPLFKLLLFYLRTFFSNKELSNNLANLDDNSLFTIYYIQRSNAFRFYSTLFFISLLATILVFAFVGTSYPIIAFLLVTTTFLFLHDCIMSYFLLLQLESIKLSPIEKEIVEKYKDANFVTKTFIDELEKFKAKKKLDSETSGDEKTK